MASRTSYSFPIPDFGTSLEHDVSIPLILEQANSGPFELDSTEIMSQNPFEDEAYEKPTAAIDTMKGPQVPTHPIPSMQEAFAESMQESSGDSTPTEERNIPKTAAARRQLLLDQGVDEITHASRWRQKPGQKHHELWKLISQISFGIYLLLNGIAKDDEQVMNILQGHVDKVDEFLESTLADFDLAQEDVDERLKFLKLPLENIFIFDAMLEDRNFRLQIVNGNERIEHVITRTAKAMNSALKDVQQGLDACKEFTIYLAAEQDNNTWKNERPDMEKVFDAMKGNVEGWYKAYVSLQTKGNQLGVSLVQLGSIVAEMDRRAGEVSRRIARLSTTSRSSMASPPASPPSHQSSRNSKQLRLSISKTLPSDPNMITPAIRAALPAFQLVQDRERPSESPSLSQDSSPSLKQEAEAEAEFILKPHTYSPAPSPRLASPRAPSPNVPTNPSPPPEVRQRSSLRQRFSLKRKDVPAPVESRPVPNQTQSSDDRYWAPRQRVHSVSTTFTQRAQERSIIINTPPSRGLDSAYCSDFEKASPPTGSHPAILNQSHSYTNGQDARSSNNSRTFSPGVPSPRSDQQFFRPVHANPNSPLQRPWTASERTANPLHQHNNSSTSNLSTSRTFHAHTPSGLGLSHPRIDSSADYQSAYGKRNQSAMGMSLMSEVTIGVDETGKKVKKKRSAFGWLKKAFSLSEEEKREFEERRRRQERLLLAEEREWERERRGERERPRWVDGKRVR